MDISSYSNERILNTIKQSYNFDAEIVEAAKELALKKGLMSSIEIDKFLTQNEIERERKKNANYDLDRMANMGELDASSSSFERWFHIIMPVAILLGCVIFYFFTGWIVFLGVGPLFAAVMAFKNKKRFK